MACTLSASLTFTDMVYLGGRVPLIEEPAQDTAKAGHARQMLLFILGHAALPIAMLYMSSGLGRTKCS